MANALTLTQLDTLRRYLLDPDEVMAIQHVQAIRHRLRSEDISEYEIVECAKMLLLNRTSGHGFEDLNEHWLNDISFDLNQMDD